jgi:hypothetical protein
MQPEWGYVGEWEERKHAGVATRGKAVGADVAISVHDISDLHFKTIRHTYMYGHEITGHGSWASIQGVSNEGLEFQKDVIQGVPIEHRR